MKHVSKAVAAGAPSVSVASQSAATGLQRPARALLGWMHTDAATLVLNSNQQTPGTREQLEIVRRCASSVASRDEGVNQDGVIEDAPPSLDGYVDELRRNPAALVYFGQGFEVQIAHIDRICGFQ